MKTKKSRRNILTGVAVWLSPLPSFAGLIDKLSERRTSRHDVIVIGAGAAGLCAAVEASDCGTDVIVLEKQKEIGGNTLISGGFYACVDTERQNKRGIEDSGEFFFQQTYQYGERKGKPELIRHMVDHATESLHWLESMGMRFQPEVFELYGSHWPRTHIPVLPLGTGYIRALSAAALKRGVTIRTNTQVEDFIFEGNRVVGVVATVDGKRQTFRAKRAVVIASGSFSANQKLIAQYAPNLVGLTTNNTPASTGEVMLAAHRHGVALRDMNAIQCLPGCPPGKKYRVRFHNDVSRFVLINNDGRRFIREDDSRSRIRDAVLSLPQRYAFSVMDCEGFQEAGILTQKEVVLAIEGQEAWKGNTLKELAVKMGVPPDNLQKTIESYNVAVQAHFDPLGKVARELRHKIEKPPFYASYAGMTIHYTEGGLDINEKAQCLDKTGRPIAGLYAAGAVTGGVHGNNRLGANGLTDAVVFGRTAGRNAAMFSP